MRVFVTGASGFIGSAVVRELTGAGHEVVGLVRSDAGAESVTAGGGRPLRGSLEDLDSLRKGATESDGVIHTAFIHDFANFAHSLEVDQRAVTAMADVLVGSDRSLVVASGVTLVAPEGRPATEDDPPRADWPRVVTDEKALAYAERGVRVAMLRLPVVHGEGDAGFIPAVIAAARAKGVSAYPGDGANRWPTVHRLDAAQLFRLAVESAPAGARLHAIAEEGVPVKGMAEVIGRHLDLPVTAVPVEDALDHFGFVGRFLAGDSWVSSAQTRERYGWRPSQPELLADLDKGHYFTE